MSLLFYSPDLPQTNRGVPLFKPNGVLSLNQMGTLASLQIFMFFFPPLFSIMQYSKYFYDRFLKVHLKVDICDLETFPLCLQVPS